MRSRLRESHSSHDRWLLSLICFQSQNPGTAGKYGAGGPCGRVLVDTTLSRSLTVRQKFQMSPYTNKKSLTTELVGFWVVRRTAQFYDFQGRVVPNWFTAKAFQLFPMAFLSQRPKDIIVTYQIIKIKCHKNKNIRIFSWK